jgi:signal transduction histidine kinase
MSKRAPQIAPPAPGVADVRTRALIEIAHTLDSNVDECQRLNRMLALLKNLLQCDRCSLLFDPDGKGRRTLLSVPSVGDGETMAQLESRLLTVLGAIENNDPLPSDGTEQNLALPVVGLDEVRGLLAIERRTGTFTRDDMRLFSIVAAQVGGYLTMLHLHHQAAALDQFKREMSALAAHDIKNPLAAVIGMVDFLSLELSGSPEYVRNCLNDIRTACNRIHRVTANLLDLARLESNQLSLRPTSLDAPALLSTLTRYRSAQASFKNVQIVIRPSPPGPRVLADEDLLSRVVDNLLDNALRYAPPGGRIELEVRQVGDRVQVRVGNDGPPIPASARATIFDKFARAEDSARLNLGLGLYFARIAMQAQGGRIWLEETDQLLTVFGLELPAAPPAAPVTS